MQLKILADESVSFKLIRYLRESNFNVASVSEMFCGASDYVVLDYARKNKSILLTEDKDFGEWIFAHHEKEVSVILLRYLNSEFPEIIKTVSSLLNEFGDRLFGKFITIRKSRYRIREL